MDSISLTMVYWYYCSGSVSVIWWDKYTTSFTPLGVFDIAKVERLFHYCNDGLGSSRGSIGNCLFTFASSKYTIFSIDPTYEIILGLLLVVFDIVKEFALNRKGLYFKLCYSNCPILCKRNPINRKGLYFKLCYSLCPILCKRNPICRILL